MNAETTSWRDILKQLIGDAKERHKVASELQVKPITLQRWINGDSDPRPENLRRLLTLFPEHRAVLSHAFAHFLAADAEIASISQPIASDLYALVLQTYATVEPSFRFQTLADTILSRALVQLNPERQGLEIAIMQCVRPRQGKKV